MMLRGELTTECASLLHLLELLCHHRGEQLLGLDEAHLHVAVRIAVESQLTGHAHGQAVEHGEVLVGEMTLGEVHLLVAADLLSLRHSEHVVELGDELLDGGDELDDTLRNDDGSEVIAVGSTHGHSLGDVVDDVAEAHTLLLDLLADEADVGLGLQGALECDVAGRAAHHLDEVPVLAG